MNGRLKALKVIFLSVVVALGGCYVSETPEIDKPKVDPKKAAENYVKLGLEYIALGKPQSAKWPLTRALELDSTSPQVNTAVAYMYQRDAEPALAEEYFKKALGYDSKYTLGRNNYGMFLYSEKRYDEALMQLKMASDDTFYENRGAIFNNIGLVYLKLNKMAEAQAAFEKASILDGDNPDNYLSVAEMNFNNQAYDQAKISYSNYVRLKPQQDAQGLWLGIRLARALGNKADETKYAESLKKSYSTSDQYFRYVDLLGNP
jgi:type IV pilus assembly protein PilF